MKILWLVSWYPSAIKPLNGDFIQRHAQASSLYNDIDVIFLEKDTEGDITKDVLKEEKQSGRLVENIIYYHAPQKNKLVDKIVSLRKYQRLYKKEIDNYMAKKGKPDLVHVHIAMKAGLIARWLKKKYNVPYVITEHWTGYLSEAKENLSDYSFFYRIANKNIIKNALAVSVVSKYLGERIKHLFNIDRYVVIPNVVNTNLFYPVERNRNDAVHFIHISTLNYQKNPEVMLEAFSLVKEQMPGFRLNIVGPANAGIKELVEKTGLKNEVAFLNEVPQTEIAKYLQTADALILYSRYETFGCVIIEANACGIPVIVSELEVFKENVQDGFNGMMADANSSEKLAEKILWFMQNRSGFNAAAIVKSTRKKYSYDVVGKHFDKWYRSFL